MKKALFTLFLIFFFNGFIHAQVGVNTVTPNAMLDIKASNQATPANTDGILIPKIDAFPLINPTLAQKGMLVYLTTLSGSNQPGFYYWNNPGWIGIVTGTAGGTLDQAYDFGGAGLGKTITADTGAVTIAGTDGLVSTGVMGVGSLVPSAIGSRMIWNPRKAAFRAGSAVFPLWENANVGDLSAAFGESTSASGSISTAFGSTTNAAGSISTAFGNSSRAIGSVATAFGISTTASGDVSTAFGSSTIASGAVSTTFGENTTASGYGSTAFGSDTRASGFNSIVTGFNTIASGSNTSASGSFNTAPSFGETVVGIGATTYTPSLNGATQFTTANATDRLLVVGNAIDADGNGGVDAAERRDALVILKNGLTRLPSTTNAMITAADGKAVLTKEYLAANSSGTLDQSYDFGGAGLGKTITADAGAVLINGTDGLVSTGTIGSGAIMPSGAGTRIVWNPRKGAFRTGTAGGTQWDDANVGDNSIASGNTTIASGNSATAFGQVTIAGGTVSTAFGSLTSASGNVSTAFGLQTTASANTSTAFGFNTTANNINATAFGASTNANGFTSTAFGLTNTASSYGETALGIGATTYVPSINGATQFRTANATDRLLLVGNAVDANNNNLVDAAERSDALVILKNGNTGIGSSTPQDKLHVVGNIRMVDGNQATGKILVSDANGTATWTTPTASGGTLDQAYDFGGAGLGKTITADAGAVLINGTDGLVSTGTPGSGAVIPAAAGTRMVWNPRKAAFRAGTVSGNQWDDANVGTRSIAFGQGTIASGTNSTALGNFTTASGSNSTVFGVTTVASGSESTAFGVTTVASGNESTAFGSNSIANGTVSSAFGRQNTASSFGETTLGIGATTYVPSINGAIQFRTANATDRLLVVGNAIDADNDGTVDVGERSDAFVILKNGNTGIGTSTPQRTLHVATGLSGVTPFAGAPLVVESSGDAYQHFLTPNTLAATGAGLLFGTPAGAIRGGIIYSPLAEKLDFRTGGNTVRMTLTNVGNLGIGTPTPLDKLHVVGNIRMVDGNQATGNILVSDANGTATWTTPTAAGGTLDQSYDFGGAGLGKTITADAGAVLINGTDGLVSTGTLGSGAVAPTGAGTRMVWNPRKGAFRAGFASFAEWDDANIGLASAAFGTRTVASGSVSTSFGDLTRATGINSTSFGNNTSASGSNSTAMGANTIASGTGATAMGGTTVASGFVSTAMGSFTTANGSSSAALGISNFASSAGETVFGVGATTYTTSVNGDIQFRAANVTDRLLVVGNAIDVNNNNFVDLAERSDALVILKNGNTGIGTSTPQTNLEIVAGNKFTATFGEGILNVVSNNPQNTNIGGSISLGGFGSSTTATSVFATVEGRKSDAVATSNAGYLAFKTSGAVVGDVSERMRITSVGDVGIGTAAPGGQFELSLNEGRKPASNTWTITSDARLKNVNGIYEKGLAEILQLKPIRYNYKNTDKKTFDQKVLDKEAYGFLAQEVQPLFPEAVGTDADGYLNFDLHPILIASVNALKELNAKNEQLEQKSSQLEKENQSLKESVQAINDKILLIIAEMEKLKK